MRILIVDDSQELREMLAVALALFDWEILQAEDGLKAFKMYIEQNNSIDAILLDQMMPIMDGLHLLPKILDVNPDMPVIMMTSYGSITLAAEFMKNGGSGFIEKPITHFEVLKIRIMEAIRHAQRKKELREIRATQEATKKLNIAKDAFLSNLSHELRTPLSAILSFAALAHRKLAEGKIADAMVMLDRLLGGQKRLVRFTTNIECLAQIYTEKWPLYPMIGDLVQLVHNVVQGMADHTSQKKLQCCILGVETLSTRFDVEAIRIALTELMNNAIKFSPKEGIIEIIVMDSKEQAQISILDAGPGIPFGENESILHPFNESSGTHSNAGGSGLGLSIARGIAQLHGGTVYAKNREDSKGTEVTFIISNPRSKKNECAGG